MQCSACHTHSTLDGSDIFFLCRQAASVYIVQDMCSHLMQDVSQSTCWCRPPSRFCVRSLPNTARHLKFPHNFIEAALNFIQLQMHLVMQAGCCYLGPAWTHPTNVQQNPAHTTNIALSAAKSGQTPVEITSLGDFFIGKEKERN